MVQQPLTPRRQLNRLDAKQMFKLTQYVDENYTKSGLNDREFALQAGTALDFPVSDSSIKTARETLDLQSNHLARLSAQPQVMHKRVEALERELVSVKIVCDNLSTKLGMKPPFGLSGG